MSSRTRLRLVLLAFGLAAAAGATTLARGMRREVRPTVDGRRLFDDVLSHLRRQYVDSIAVDDLYRKAVAGLLDELGDPHSLYLEPDRLKRLAESTSGNFVGVGLQVDGRDGWPTILAALPGGPGERAGLHAGDRMVEAGGKPMRGLTEDEVRAILRGPAGSAVEVVVERPGSRARITVRIVRGEIHRRAVRRTALLGDGVGYVDVKVFSDSTQLEVARAVDSLRAMGMQRLILDLRGNLGGLLAQGVGVADLFLDRGDTLVRIRGRIPEANTVFTDAAPQRWPAMPLVVLVDEASASASEIVAGALQDFDRAVVMGRATYGKGSAQSLYPVETGGALKLTTARWFTPRGRSIDRVADDDSAAGAPPRAPRFRSSAGRRLVGTGGITPDLVVGDTVPAPAELALAGALGRRVPEFRDALTAYALQVKVAGPPGDVRFPVTPAMREGLWRVLRGRGIAIDRAVYDAAAPILDKLIAREVTRYAFPGEGEVTRALADDEVVQAARRLVAGATSPADLLRRVPRDATRAEAAAR